MVSRTLQEMSIDFIHFLIVLVPTFFGFACAGMIIFGRRYELYSTLEAALANNLQIIMESQFDWASFNDGDFLTTLLWVWVYSVVVVLVMLNMILAIIVDVYQEVRMHAGDSMTIWDQCIYICRSIIYRKEWVPYAQLMERVAEMPATILKTDLPQAFPEMHDYQLEYLVNACMNKSQVVERVGFNRSATAQMIAAINLSLEEIYTDLLRMKKKGWFGKGLEVGNDVDRGKIQEILTNIAVQSHWMSLTERHVSNLQDRMDSEFKKKASPWIMAKKEHQAARAPQPAQVRAD